MGVKIQVEYSIFDDPVKCENMDTEQQCTALYYGIGKCTIFNEKLTGRYSGFLKCNKCKAAYQKAKDNQ